MTKLRYEWNEIFLALKHGRHCVGTHFIIVPRFQKTLTIDRKIDSHNRSKQYIIIIFLFFVAMKRIYWLIVRCFHWRPTHVNYSIDVNSIFFSSFAWYLTSTMERPHIHIVTLASHFYRKNALISAGFISYHCLLLCLCVLITKRNEFRGKLLNLLLLEISTRIIFFKKTNNSNILAQQTKKKETAIGDQSPFHCINNPDKNCKLLLR